MERLVLPNQREKYHTLDQIFVDLQSDLRLI